VLKNGDDCCKLPTVLAGLENELLIVESIAEVGIPEIKNTKDIFGLPEERGTIFFQNIGKHLPGYADSEYRIFIVTAIRTSNVTFVSISVHETSSC
jgi:hypothetical protein